MGAQSEGGKPGTYPPPDPRIGFVLALGRALHRAGEPANRLEDLMEHVARKVGIQTQFFFTPTSIFAAFGSEERQRTHLIRTEPSSPDLGRLARLDIVVVRVQYERVGTPEFAVKRQAHYAFVVEVTGD